MAANCLLCSKHLPKHTYPDSAQSAQIYSETLIKLFKFGINDVRQERDSKTKNLPETTYSVNDHRFVINDNAERRNCLDRLEKNLLKVSYCYNCVQSIRKVNVRFREADRIRLQILEFRKQIVDLLLQHCSELSPPVQLEDDGKKLQIANPQYLRRDIIQGFNLVPEDTNVPQIISTEPSSNTIGIPFVRLKRLEEMPEALAQYESIILNQCYAVPTVVKNEPLNILVDELNLETVELAEEIDPEDCFLGFENSLSPINLTFDESTKTDTDDQTASTDTKTGERISKSQNSSVNRKSTKHKKRTKARRARTDKLSSEKPVLVKPKPTYPCSYEGCDFVSPAWKVTYLHVKSLHGLEAWKDVYECNVCNKKFLRRDNLQTHKTKIHSTGKCSECSILFPSLKELRAHERDVHKKGFQCSLCTYIATTRPLLKTHLRLVHARERNYVCPHCGLNFRTAGRLTHHQGSKHPELNPISDLPDISKYKCEECNKIFCDPYSLRKHTSTIHLKQFKYYCEICGQGIFNKARIKHHMVGHTREKNFECNICHAKFLRNQGLIGHMQRHTGDLRYKCKTCSKTFVNSGALRRHEQIHEGVLRYFCPTCNKGFPVHNYLYVHMRSHETPEEREKRKKKSKERNVPPLAKLYNELRKSKRTSASVPIESNVPEVQEYQMAYDFTRERKTISSVISSEELKDPLE